MANVQTSAFRLLTTAANLTRYNALGDVQFTVVATESQTQITHRIGGTLSLLLVDVDSNANTGTTTIKTRINGADGNQVVSYASGETGEKEDAVNTDTVVAGDELNYQLVTGATGGNFISRFASTVFSATSNTGKRLGTSRFNASNASTSHYSPIEGWTNTSTTEADMQYQFKTAGTLKNMCGNMANNTRTTTTTYHSRINGANGNLTVAYGSGVTGLQEDTVNSDTIAVDDLVCWTADTGTGTGNIEGLMFADFETTNSKFIGGATFSGAASTIGTSLTRWSHPFARGESGTAISSEGQAQLDMQFAQTISEMQSYVSSNGITANTTLRYRVNGADGNMLITYASGETGRKNDSVNTETIVADDETNFVFTTGGTGTTILFRVWGTMHETSPVTAASITFFPRRLMMGVS